MGAAIFLDIPRSFIAISRRLVIRSGSHLNAIQPFDRNSGDFSCVDPSPVFGENMKLNRHPSLHLACRALLS
jgi:hypothetical protein